MNPIEIVIIGSAVWFFGMFLVIIPYAIGRLGGWAKLAPEYRFKGKFHGSMWRFQDITLRGWCSYSGCVTVGANAEGLYINTIFWVSHPPLFIPWSELSGKRRTVKLLWIPIRLVEFTTQRVPSVTITLRESLVQKIAASHPTQIPAARDDSEQSPVQSSTLEVPQ
jgi:hypothetical protein